MKCSDKILKKIVKICRGDLKGDKFFTEMS